MHNPVASRMTEYIHTFYGKCLNNANNLNYTCLVLVSHWFLVETLNVNCVSIYGCC